MTCEIPPVEGQIYRGRSSWLRRVVKVHGPHQWCGRWLYDVEWAYAKHGSDYSGKPRLKRAYCMSWEAWVQDRV